MPVRAGNACVCEVSELQSIHALAQIRTHIHTHTHVPINSTRSPLRMFLATAPATFLGSLSPFTRNSLASAERPFFALPLHAHEIRLCQCLESHGHRLQRHACMDTLIRVHLNTYAPVPTEVRTHKTYRNCWNCRRIEKE